MITEQFSNPTCVQVLIAFKEMAWELVFYAELATRAILQKKSQPCNKCHMQRNNSMPEMRSEPMTAIFKVDREYKQIGISSYTVFKVWSPKRLFCIHCATLVQLL